MQKMSDIWSAIIIWYLHRIHSSTVQSLTYPIEKLMETVGTAVTVLENVMSLVAHLVELYVTDAV